MPHRSARTTIKTRGSVTENARRPRGSHRRQAVLDRHRRPHRIRNPHRYRLIHRGSYLSGFSTPVGARNPSTTGTSSSDPSWPLSGPLFRSYRACFGRPVRRMLGCITVLTGEMRNQSAMKEGSLVATTDVPAGAAETTLVKRLTENSFSVGDGRRPELRSRISNGFQSHNGAHGAARWWVIGSTGNLPAGNGMTLSHYRLGH